MAVKWYEFEMANGKRCRIANPSFSKADSFSAIDRWNVTEAEFNRVLAEWEADQQAVEPAEPQPIDKLGWWLIDGRPEVLVTCHSDSYFYDCDGEQCEVMTHKGIFLAEITDEEIVAYHREGIVPKCPVEVQS